MNDIERELKELGERTAERVTYREAPRDRIVRRARIRRGAVFALPTVTVVLIAAVVFPRLDLEADRAPGQGPTLAAVAQATENAGTARVRIDMSMEFDGKTTSGTATGVISFADLRSHLRYEMEGALLGGSSLEMISIGDTVYQRETGESKWIESTMASPEGAMPFGRGPDEFLGYLESISARVTTVGRGVIDGVAVTRLQAVVDPADLAGGAAAAAGVEMDPMDVWVDGQNRLRKLAMEVFVEGPATGGSGRTSVTVAFSDFGVPVDVEAPPVEDVTTRDEPDDSTEPSLPDPDFTHTSLVTGQQGPSGPRVQVFAGPDPDGVCVTGLPVDTVGVSIVDEASERSILTIEGGGVPLFDDTEAGVCDPQGGETDDLVEDPSKFTLRIERADEADMVVPLTGSIKTLEE